MDNFGKLSQGQTNIIDLPGLSYGLFHAMVAPMKTFGIVMSVTFPGVMMDIGHLRHLRVAKDNDTTTWINYNQMRGQQQSVLEASVPEQFFSDPVSAIKPEGVSTVKLLATAAAQGQKIFTITQANIATALPQLQHSASVLDEIRNAVAAAKEVTISEKPVAIGGWMGAGYAVIDPATGVGGYLIEGGAKGSVVEIENGLKTILGVTNTVSAYIGLAINIVANLIDCYGEEIRSVAMFFGIAAVVGILASVLSRSGAAGAAIGYASVAIVGVLATSSAQAGNKSRECKMECSKATKDQLKMAGLDGIEEAFKMDHFATPTSAYDICACKDGAIVIAGVGTCGRTQNFITTGVTWK